MFTDALLNLSANQALTALNGSTTTSIVSTNSVNLTDVRDIGEGSTLYGVFNLNSAITGGSGVEMEIILSSDEHLVNNIESIASTGTQPVSQLTLNSIHAVKFSPKVGRLGQQYLGARYTGVGAVSTGNVTCNCVETIQDGKKFYPSGWSV